MVETAAVAEAPTPTRPTSLQLIALLPGLAVAGLALLYATGALIKTSQLRDAGVSVQDALPLVPIEQLLALGIGTMMSSLAIVVGWTATIALFVYFARRRARRGTTKEPPQIVVSPAQLHVLRLVLYGLIVALFALTLTVVSLFAAIAVFAPAWVMGDVITAQGRGDARRAAFLLACAYLVVVGARVAQFARVRIDLNSAGVLRASALETAGALTQRGQLDPDHLAEVIASGLEASEPRVVTSALEVLVRFPEMAATLSFEQALAEPDDLVRRSCYRALYARGRIGEAELERVATDQSAASRRWALNTAIADGQHSDLIAGMLANDSDGYVRLRARSFLRDQAGGRVRNESGTEP